MQRPTLIALVSIATVVLLGATSLRASAQDLPVSWSNVIVHNSVTATFTITSPAMEPTVTVSCNDDPVSAFPPPPDPYHAVTPTSISGSNYTFSAACRYDTLGQKFITARIVTGIEAFNSVDPGVNITSFPPGTPPTSGGSYIPPNVVESFTSNPAPPVWGQTVSFSATIDSHPEFAWIWSLGSGAVPAGTPTQGTDGLFRFTRSEQFALPGSYDTQFLAQSGPPIGADTPIDRKQVNVYGRQQVLAVDCGTPVYGFPVTLSATLFDLSPQPSAMTLSDRPVNFFVNGAYAGTAKTGVVLAGGTTARAALTVNLPLGTGSYSCAVGIADNVLVPLTDPSGVSLGLVAKSAIPDANAFGTFPIGTTLQTDGAGHLTGNFLVPGPGGTTTVVSPLGTFGGGSTSGVQNVGSSLGQITGGVRELNGTGKAGFSIDADPTRSDGTRIKGELEYHATNIDFKAKTITHVGISPDGRIAYFSGTGVLGGKKNAVDQAFVVRVEDNGDPNKDKGDRFQIAFDGLDTAPAWLSDGAIRTGNVKIHRDKRDLRPAGDYIVVLQDYVDADQKTRDLEKTHGFSAAQRYGSALKGLAGTFTADQINAIDLDPDVAFVSPDGLVTADGMVTLQSRETVPVGIRRIGAATTTTVHQASTVAVAVLDTGIDLKHGDLNAVNGTNCVKAGTSAQDDNGHGTHVAGTIGAKNNGAGVVGVAPGTTLYAVKVLTSSGSGTWSQIICGIDWVTANAASLKIKVANLSLGGAGSSDSSCGSTNNDALHAAICRSTAAGVSYVAAAGNGSTSSATTVPAAYPEVLTVTAMTDTDGKSGGVGAAPSCTSGEKDDAYATYSNYASADNGHTIAGPGTCVYSTWLSNGYKTLSGTSMATPHVAGTVALCYGNGSAGPCAGLAPAQVIAKLRADAQAAATGANGFAGDPTRPLSGRYYGYLVNAAAY